MTRRIKRFTSITIGVLAAIGAAACQPYPTDLELRYAVLESADNQTMSKVKSVLAEAMGRAQIELGPSDPTTSSALPVLPPPATPNEDRSTATPTMFDIMIGDGQCYVVRRDGGEKYSLGDLACRAL